MFVTMFFVVAGQWMVALVNWYLSNQIILNSIVILYGIIVSVAHMNLRRIDLFLIERNDGSPDEVLEKLKGDGAANEMEAVRSKFRLALISTPNGLWPLRLNRKHLVTALERLREKERTRGRKNERGSIVE